MIESVKSAFPWLAVYSNNHHIYRPISQLNGYVPGTFGTITIRNLHSSVVTIDNDMGPGIPGWANHPVKEIITMPLLDRIVSSAHSLMTTIPVSNLSGLRYRNVVASHVQFIYSFTLGQTVAVPDEEQCKWLSYRGRQVRVIRK